ncbi:MAG TPA: DinB family protein [Bryobacterales bacterium]|jgi:uncharacterized damage-inducible protein DinB|nr:DinB family protein [Bryobacterales bacterium]
MKQTSGWLLIAALFGTAAWGAEPAERSAMSRSFDRQLSGVEREVVSLAEALPADKFAFAPTQGEFQGVRTFAQQASHIAATLYMIASALLGEKNPSEAGKDENGPASLKTKQDVVNYLKAAFAYAHKAMNTLTDQNATEMIGAPFGNNKVPRVSLAVMAISHTFDHYGQMVVYARMNGVVPPASRR